jgi:hypothetical protein
MSLTSGLAALIFPIAFTLAITGCQSGSAGDAPASLPQIQIPQPLATPSPIPTPLRSPVYDVDVSRPAGRAGGFQIYQSGKLVLEGYLPFARTDLQDTRIGEFLSFITDGNPEGLKTSVDFSEETHDIAKELHHFDRIDPTPDQVASTLEMIAREAKRLINPELPYAYLLLAYSTEETSDTAEGVTAVNKPGHPQKEQESLGPITPGYLEPDTNTDYGDRLVKADSTLANQTAGIYETWVSSDYDEVFVGAKSGKPPQARTVRVVCLKKKHFAHQPLFRTIELPTNAECGRAFGDVIKITPMSAIEYQNYIDRLDNVSRLN